MSVHSICPRYKQRCCDLDASMRILHLHSQWADDPVLCARDDSTTAMTSSFRLHKNEFHYSIGDFKIPRKRCSCQSCLTWPRRCFIQNQNTYRLPDFPIVRRPLQHMEVHSSCCQHAIVHSHLVESHHRNRVSLPDSAYESPDGRHSLEFKRKKN